MSLVEALELEHLWQGSGRNGECGVMVVAWWMSGYVG